jgi:outer membrane protein OmpA-like peptidoglycan-associated protein
MKSLLQSKGLRLATFAVLAVVLLGGCAQLSRTEKGAAIGAGAGAVVGGVVGKATGSTARGAVIGGMVGGTVGAVIGHQMDKQAKELEEKLGEAARVERVADGIQVTFDAAILFAFDSSDLSQEARNNLARLAQSLQEYDNTRITIVGHTDSVGSASYNQTLSERRAQAASSQLARMGVSNNRLTTIGMGFRDPVASNDNAFGRSQNRRVEVKIEVTEEYRRQLEQQQQQQNR